MNTIVGDVNRSMARRTLIVSVHRLNLKPNQTVNVQALETPLCCVARPLTNEALSVNSVQNVNNAKALGVIPSTSLPKVSTTPSRLYTQIDEAYRKLPWVVASKFVPVLTSTPSVVASSVSSRYFS